jgi:hypothetical protein
MKFCDVACLSLAPYRFENSEVDREHSNALLALSALKLLLAPPCGVQRTRVRGHPPPLFYEQLHSRGVRHVGNLAGSIADLLPGHAAIDELAHEASAFRGLGWSCF